MITLHIRIARGEEQYESHYPEIKQIIITHYSLLITH